MSSLVISADTFMEFPETLIVVKHQSQFNEIPTIKTTAFDCLKQPNRGQGCTRLIFVRHGESNSNKEKTIAGRTLKTDLSDVGVEQAKEVGAMLDSSNIAIDQAFSSPTLRAIKTAQTILSELKSSIPINQDKRLHEKWYGPYEGAGDDKYRPITEKEKTEIPLLSTFLEKFAYKADAEMESMQEVYIRVREFIKNIYLNYPDKNLLIATHNGVMKSLFMADSACRGYDVEYRSFVLGNCSVIVLEVYPNGKMKLVGTSGLHFTKNDS